MASKLSKNQKQEIVNESLKGKSFVELAKIYGCTPGTITRTVKTLLSADEYAELKKQRVRSNSLKQRRFSEPSADSKQSIDALKADSVDSHFSQGEFLKKDNSSKNVAFEADLTTDLKDQESQDHFKEVIPLVSDFAWEEQKEVAAKPLSKDLFPETVYMLVDKKVELETKPLKEFSQWSFLPDQDQDRQTILLFSNQRAAKRTCSRNQRVLKVPNPEVFKLSSPYLLSKGITRIVLDDCLIALDMKADEPLC